MWKMSVLSFCVAVSASAASASVGVLESVVPGRGAEVRGALAAALKDAGMEVRALTVAELEGGAATNCAALVVPDCAAVSASAAVAAVKAAEAGVPTVFVGGPLLDERVWRVGDAWKTKGQIAAWVESVPLRHEAFGLAALDTAKWRRSHDGRAGAGSSLTVEPDRKALRLSLAALSGWDCFFSPKEGGLYGEGDDVFAFTAKAAEPGTAVAVEMIEKDGSRWIAAATVGTEWRRVALAVSDFHYWQDSAAKGRGGAGDCLKPREAASVGFGCSMSHTPSMAGRAATVWMRDFGSFQSSIVMDEPLPEVVEGVYPRYKLTEVGGDVCAIPRRMGEGFGWSEDATRRFVPLRFVAGTDAASEWLMLENRKGGAARRVAGFGTAEVSPERIAAAVRRMVTEPMLIEAGTDHPAYWPGETVRVGAKWEWPLGVKSPSGTVTVNTEVFDTAGKSVWSSGLVLGETACWQPPEEPADYRVRVTLALDGREMDRIEYEFSILTDRPAPKGDFVEVRDGGFRLRGAKWTPVGINFWPRYIAGLEAKEYWAGWLTNAQYAPTLVKRDVEHMAAMGISMASVQAPPRWNERNLLAFLRLCEKNGIRVNLYDGHLSPFAFDEEGFKEFLVITKLAGNPTVFAYDTIWEPGNSVFRDDGQRARWDAAWREWIVAEYGSVARAEKDWGRPARRNAQGEVIGPETKWFAEDGGWTKMMASYRRFMDNLTSRAWGRATRRLRELCPNQLVSFRQGNTLPHDFALSGPVRHIDFIGPEGYAVRDTDEDECAIGFITRYCKATTCGKPVVWAEFGKSVWDNDRLAEVPALITAQKQYCERFFRTALAAGASGVQPWWWPGGYRQEEKSDFGVISPSGEERPAAKLIREYGPRYKASEIENAPGEIWMAFDRDGHAGGYWHAAFNEGAAAWRDARAQGRLLGVRLAGDGTTSADCPMLAVGGVPCDGTNPPKYLDAEFDELQVSGTQVRATVGNVGRALWLPPSEAGEKGGCVLAVRDTAGKPVFTAPVSARVPCLGGATLEFTLPAMPAGTALRFRMEAQGRTPFGESRVVTAK